MIACDDLLGDLQRLTREQVRLALLVDATPVVAVLFNLALFGTEPGRITERLCEER